MRYQYPPLLRKIQDDVEERLGVTFNHVMLNLYEDGNVYIGNHRDNLENRSASHTCFWYIGNVCDLNPSRQRIIASVSLGAPRMFVMTQDPLRAANRGRKKLCPTSQSAASRQSEEIQISHGGRPGRVPGTRRQWILDSGSLLVMQGDTQKFWKHQIPKCVLEYIYMYMPFRQLTVPPLENQGWEMVVSALPFGNSSFEARRKPFAHNSRCSSCHRLA